MKGPFALQQKKKNLLRYDICEQLCQDRLEDYFRERAAIILLCYYLQTMKLSDSIVLRVALTGHSSPSNVLNRLLEGK